MTDALFDLAPDQPPASPPTDPAAITWEQARAEYGLPDFVVRPLARPRPAGVSDTDHTARLHAGLNDFIETCDWLTLRALDNRISRACTRFGVPVPPAMAARRAARQGEASS
ncbi:hypothetical protein [Streptomyces olivaceus]|uniref:hypothetical protein n=1 Tax=Streptomyces olivaceus TaxID=47716 RepID=UPI0022EF2740|nr:hypothetical protein [Streptomyces olivaceus]GHI98087.1 hypothetical protein TPA0905_75580 [Streptomyces olivaceus]